MADVDALLEAEMMKNESLRARVAELERAYETERTLVDRKSLRIHDLNEQVKRLNDEVTRLREAERRI